MIECQKENCKKWGKCSFKQSLSGFCVCVGKAIIFNPLFNPMQIGKDGSRVYILSTLILPRHISDICYLHPFNKNLFNLHPTPGKGVTN